jgi:hypothetical protein
MNKLFTIVVLSLAFFLTKTNVGYSQNNSSNNLSAPQKYQQGGNSISSIDAGDTVYFDIINLSVVGNVLAIPMYIKSDDIVNAMDFKLKYNHTNLLFDSIQLISNCFDQTTFFESPFDSSIRFTSNSFLNYPSDTLLLKVYFQIVSGTFNDSDFFGQAAFLNGLTCTAYLVVPPPVSVAEINEIPNLKLYPNPVINELHISGEKLTEIHIFDINGKLVDSYDPSIVFSNYRMDVSYLNQGSYVVKINAGDLTSIKQIIVNR